MPEKELTEAEKAEIERMNAIKDKRHEQYLARKARRIKRMFSDPDYRKELHKSGRNWMDISDDEAMQKFMAFLESISF